MKRTRIPFSIGEEVLNFADCLEAPMTIEIEVRVAGRLDEARLRNAIRRAAAVHPLTRVRRSAGRFLLRPPLWELTDTGVADVLEVAHCEDDMAFSAARAEFCGRPLPVNSAPALRCLLARRPGGDSLVLCAHHAIMDGMGGFRFLRSVGRAYAGAADPVPAIDPLAARQLRDQFGGKAPAAGARVERLRSMPGEPTFVAPTTHGPRSGYGLCRLEVAADQRRRLRPRRYGPSATHNDLLLAALHRAIDAWNAGKSQPSDAISVLVPANLRPREWYNEIVANMVMSGEVISTPESRVTDEALMAAVVAQTQQIKAGDRFASILSMPRWLYRQIPLILLVLSLLPRNKGRCAGVLTYMGRLDSEVPDFGPTVGPVTGIWGSPPAAAPMAVALGCGWFQGRLTVSVRYRRAVLDDAAAQEFSALFLKSLLGLADCVPSERSAPPVHGLGESPPTAAWMSDEMNYV